ncbi:hypothetical protein D1007_56520 [Hordeum vulgare]|nr:hypothetical protein D1007_56520 [Hordeum vulgare]
MVYEDEGSNDLSSLDISSSSDDMMYRIPASIDDEDYMGIENSALDVCLEHGLPPERRVAFEGFETGRRFLVCAQPTVIVYYSTVIASLAKRFWLVTALSLLVYYNTVIACLLQNSGLLFPDQEWPPTMQNALLKLWEMLEDSKSGRRDDNLENSLKIHHLTEEKRNLDANYDKLVEDVNQLLNLAEAQGGVITTQKANHLKEKDKLNDEILVLNLHIDGLKKGIENLIKRRDELKIQIADQLKALEKNQEKLEMIRDILDGRNDQMKMKSTMLCNVVMQDEKNLLIMYD